jgi:hypothetical protein
MQDHEKDEDIAWVLKEVMSIKRERRLYETNQATNKTSDLQLNLPLPDATADSLKCK